MQFPLLSSLPNIFRFKRDVHKICKQEAVLTALLDPYLTVCLVIVLKLTETTSAPSKG